MSRSLRALVVLHYKLIVTSPTFDTVERDKKDWNV
jgi:hypothetical protein